MSLYHTDLLFGVFASLTISKGLNWQPLHESILPGACTSYRLMRPDALSTLSLYRMRKTQILRGGLCLRTEIRDQVGMVDYS